MAEKTLAELEKELVNATNLLVERRREASFARSQETSALNAVNDIQKRIDATFTKLRSDSPNETDWNRRAWMKEAA